MNKSFLILMILCVSVAQAHQIVVFAVNGLVSESLNMKNMPLVSKLAKSGAFTLTMRANDRIRDDDVTWSAVFYGADGGAWGGQGVAPSDYGLMRSWMEVLEEDYGYGVAIFSDEPGLFSVGRAAKLMSDYDVPLDKSQLELPGDLENAVVIFHMAGLDRVGGSQGYRSINYYAFVSCIDRRIHRMVGSAWAWQPNNTTFLLVVNRGGVDYGHQSFKIGTLQVPFAIWGHGVTGHLEGHATLTEQIAPTLFSLFNWTKPDSWFAHTMPLLNGRGANYSSYNASHPHTQQEEKIVCRVARSVPHGHLSRAMLAGVFVFLSAMLLMNIFFRSS